LRALRSTGTIIAMVRALAFALVCLLSVAAAPTQKIKPTVAVLAFDYTGKDTTLEPLREGLAQMLISDVPSLANVNVVERTRLNAILAEHKLGRSGKVDTSSAAKLGKLLGARFLILGNFFDMGPSMRIDARVVEVETGKIVRAVGVNGASADFLAIEQDLAGKLSQAIATALPAEVQVTRPTRPKPAQVKSTTVVTYGRALRAMDSGKKSEAQTLLAEVVKEAPEFRLAKSELNALLE
jgi:TolB-like protein